MGSAGNALGRRAPLALAALALAFLGHSLAASAAPAASLAAAPPPVTISPLPGTPDASPQTQISFLGVPAGDLSGVTVIGSRSGRHGGRLAAYANGEGASFLVARRFTPGETVRVGATAAFGPLRRVLGTTFTVARPIAIRPDGPHLFPAIAGSVLSLRSRPDLSPPTVTAPAPAPDRALGDIFLTPVFGDSQAGPMIVTPGGGLVWFAPEPAGYQAANLRVQRYLGAPVLTYWQGRIAIGHGVGDGVILASDYRRLATVRAGNGLAMDMHDFTLGPGGVAYITVYDPVRADLRSAGGPANGALDDSVVQEIDVRTGLVMFEWHAYGHVPLGDSHLPLPASGTPYDFFHLNTIQLLGGGDLLINARNTWATYELSQASGRILWEVGGRQSSFVLGPGVRFAYQHDATLLPGGQLQLFDNEDAPQVRSQSRGVLVRLDFRTHRATLVRAYVLRDQPLLTPSQGDVEDLANGDRFVGFGQLGTVAQFTAAGRPDFVMELPQYVQSYRAFRFPWSATPAGTRPAVVATRTGGVSATDVAVSWNGATTVRRWQLLAGPAPTLLRPVGAPVDATGFETSFSAPTSAPVVAVRALGPEDRALATSAAVAVAS